jgi:hypothetical protein
VGVQEVGWEGSGTELEGKWNENLELGTGLFVHKRILSALKRVRGLNLLVIPNTIWKFR